MKSIATPTAKLPRETCKHCGLQAPAPIVVDEACANAAACERRIQRVTKRRKKS